jgi:hypothetical protein
VTGKVAIIGAPLTGKTRLALELKQHLNGWSNPPAIIECTDLSQLSSVDMTLLMGLDLPTPPSLPPGQYEHRLQSDSRLREMMRIAQTPFSTVYGLGESRSSSALQAIEHRFNRLVNTPETSGWIWNCGKCSDAQCEHQLFRGLVSS